MGILKDLPELLEADVITQETADKIQHYYSKKESITNNRLFIVFGILGALLVGLGILLIIAHNWDELSRKTKTFLSFLPLVIGQAFCGYSLIKKQDKIAWTESTATFLFLAVGACISLISQVYNIPGELSSFLLSWMLLCLPLIYVMKSSIASILYLVGITCYACETGYGYSSSSETYLYWLLLLLAIPHYYYLYKKKYDSNFIFFHNWIIPLSVIIVLGSIADSAEELMYIAYFSLFGLYFLIGDLEFFKRQKPRNNGYLILGSLGTIVLLLILSFDWFWSDLQDQKLTFNEIVAAPEFFASLIISIVAGGMLFRQMKRKTFNKIQPIEPVFIFFIATFILGIFTPVSVILINLFVLGIGIITLLNGSKHNHLGILNYGLLIITALVVCRFFDSDLSFVTRGILFVSVGLGFFIANFRMLKKEKPMNSKHYFILAFVIVAIVQLYIPARMILNREEVLENGREFKFKTAPIDPYDIFRGKYIDLRYADNTVSVYNEASWKLNEPIYVVFTQDDKGFATIQSVSKELPAEGQFFFKAKVYSVTSDSSNLLTIEYPFSRYYMEESKALDAEHVYRESLSDSSKITYALVNIKQGESVLKDVLIDGVSIQEIVKNEMNKK